MISNLMVRVVSLPNDNRREKFKKPLDGLFDFAFFDAFNECPASLEYCETAALIHKGRPLSRQELGCYASHIELWKIFLKSKYEYVLILEDDVSFDWECLIHIFENKSILQLGGVLKLFNRFPASHAIIGCTDKRFVTRIFNYSSGTQAYIMGRSTARRLLNYCYIPSRPIDDQIDREWDHGIYTYSIFPSPCYERAGQSRITSENAVYKLSKKQAIRRILYCALDYVKIQAYSFNKSLHTKLSHWREFK